MPRSRAVAIAGFEPLVEVTVVAEAGERVGEREPDRAEDPVRRSLVQRDRRKRTGQGREQIRRPLPEHDQHECRRCHQRERQDRPVHVRADEAHVDELRPRRGHRGRDQQQVRRVKHRRGECDLEQEMPPARAVGRGWSIDPASVPTTPKTPALKTVRIAACARAARSRRCAHVDERAGRPAEEHERRRRRTRSPSETPLASAPSTGTGNRSASVDAAKKAVDSDQRRRSTAASARTRRSLRRTHRCR